ncbi:hypothetical protein [Nostoc sp. DedQUE07]|nr:hypothetical protein [Nostoc sp. DedQUE07]MDZ8130666.1 hypothetical protein [Nostoc sp. DedQUE07]
MGHWAWGIGHWALGIGYAEETKADKEEGEDLGETCSIIPPCPPAPTPNS